MAEVLILNPDPVESKKIESSLGADCNCTLVKSSKEAQSLLKNIHFDAAMIDMSAKSLLDSIGDLKTPFLLTSTKSSPELRIEAFSLGALDFIELPIRPDELRLRLKSKIEFHSKKQTPEAFKTGPIKANLEQQSIQIHKTELNLTLIEFQILLFLLKNPSRVISRQELCKELKLKVECKNSRKVDAHISNLRKKLGSFDRILGSVYGKGYVFRENFL